MNTENYIDDAVRLLAEKGYEQGEYNPHNVRAWLVYDEHGHLGVVLGSHEQEALDEAADSGVLDRLLMSDEDYQEYSSNGWDDSYIHLGNASEPFWSEYLGLIEIDTMENI